MAKTENTVKNEIKEVPERPPIRSRNRKKEKDRKSSPLSLKLNTRVVKISGLVFIGASLFITISMVSFLFSWQADQSLVQHVDWQNLSREQIGKIQNWMGLFGAMTSNILIFHWFGLASFLFAPVLFLTGFRWLFDSKNIPLTKVYTLASLSVVFFSMLLAFFANTLFAIFLSPRFGYAGGAFGFETNAWISALIGPFGVAIFLIIAFLSYLILAFNISFKLPRFLSASKPANENTEDTFDEDTIHAVADVDQPDDADLLGDDIDPNDFKLIVLPEKKNRVEELLKKEPEIPDIHKTGGVDFKVKTVVNQPIVQTLAPVEDTRNANGSWYKYPGLDILREHEIANVKVDTAELEERKNLIVETLENYKIKIDRIEATIGPTVTLYEIVPAAGIRISRIKSLEDDIALSLSALGIRIIAPMPGKGTIGIEVPNQNPQIVSIKESLASPAFINSTFDLPIVLGKTISGNVFVADLTKMPHLLMAGATGQGKSVGINTIIASILYKKHPEDVKFILIDPKKVELSLFKNIDHHFLPELPDGQEAIITDTQMVVAVLKSLCVEMDKRYDNLKDAEVRNIKEYNKKIEKGLLDTNLHKRLPYIVLVIDELADLMMTAGKEVELPIARLAQLARAIGIHLIVATQRPSVNIITGTIKANFPSRIAFRVTSRIDSRTILDTGGAEQLIGRGDMLYSTGNDLIRLQCPFIDTDEVDRLTKHIQGQPYPEPYRLNIYTEDGSLIGVDEMDGDLDPLFEDAARLVVTTQQGSTSMLQRRLKLGYNRAGRLMDQLERAKIVGVNEGSKAREVLYSDESALEAYLKDLTNRY